MTIDSMHDMFVYRLQEMYYVENQLVDVLDELSMETSNEDLAQGFADHRDETQGQAERLEEVFDRIDETPEEHRSPVFDALLEERDEFFEQAADDDDLRDLYRLGAGIKTESIEITGYEGLLMLAQKLDLPSDVTNPLEDNLDQEERTRKKLKAMGEESTVKQVFARLAG